MANSVNDRFASKVGMTRTRGKSDIADIVLGTLDHLFHNMSRYLFGLRVKIPLVTIISLSTQR